MGEDRSVEALPMEGDPTTGNDTNETSIDLNKAVEEDPMSEV